MATDPNKKTLRHFQCRDYLWETFEQMSAELECSVDYLVNEAMRQYARSRSHGGVRPVSATTNNISMPPPGVPGMRESGSPTVPPGSMTIGNTTIPPLPGGMRSTPSRGAPIPPVPTPAAGVSPRIPPLPSVPPGRAPSGRASSPQMPAVGRTVPPGAARTPSSGGPPPFPGSSPHESAPAVPMPSLPPSLPSSRVASSTVEPNAAPALFAHYQGQRYPVNKEEFVIGRGQRSSDLVIKDSNVSRRHAVVVLHNGQYWMVDQQSTNGVEFMGARIDRKRIDDGDVFKICDYEISFTYQ